MHTCPGMTKNIFKNALQWMQWELNNKRRKARKAELDEYVCNLPGVKSIKEEIYAEKRTQMIEMMIDLHAEMEGEIRPSDMDRLVWCTHEYASLARAPMRSPLWAVWIPARVGRVLCRASCVLGPDGRYERHVLCLSCGGCGWLLRVARVLSRRDVRWGALQPRAAERRSRADALHVAGTASAAATASMTSRAASCTRRRCTSAEGRTRCCRAHSSSPAARKHPLPRHADNPNSVARRQAPGTTGCALRR